jgi:Domain of unknown function (DUF4062)
MREKRLQIFVSSTYTDLKEERQAAVEAILSSGNIPAGMELFAAGDESQMTVIKRWKDESDVYLLILGGRYGSIEKTTNKSYIQLEYEYALAQNKALFAVVISEDALERKVKAMGSSVVEQDNAKELKLFKSSVLSNLVKFWDDKKDIMLAIYETLADFAQRKELIGWVRGDNAVNAGLVAEEIAKLTKENSELRQQLTNNSQRGDAALYLNLTYSEVEALLKRERVMLNGNQQNLFDVLFLLGEVLSKKSVVQGDKETALQRLALLNIVRPFRGGDNRPRFEFTDDGHKFYVKARLLMQKSV